MESVVKLKLLVVHKSTEQRIEIDRKRERADWLLRNILPEHVVEPLRQLGGTHSRNHPYVGVLFASLINFHVIILNTLRCKRMHTLLIRDGQLQLRIGVNAEVEAFFLLELDWRWSWTSQLVDGSWS
jgi:hypothetical protein